MEGFSGGLELQLELGGVRNLELPGWTVPTPSLEIDTKCRTFESLTDCTSWWKNNNYLLRRGGYVSAFVRLSVSGITQKLSMNFDEIFPRSGTCDYSIKRLDFGCDPDHDADPGIFKEGIFAIWDTCGISCLFGGLRSPSVSNFVLV